MLPRSCQRRQVSDHAASGILRARFPAPHFGTVGGMLTPDDIRSILHSPSMPTEEAEAIRDAYRNWAEITLEMYEAELSGLDRRDDKSILPDTP